MLTELFPERTCCECGQSTRRFIRLVNVDTDEEAGRKYFCDEHYPKSPESGSSAA
jgi:hypothetical protein